jgi:hypothetical protein
MVHTTPAKKDKVDTSLAEAITAQALVAQLGSKASANNFADNDPDLLNFIMAESEIIYQMSSQL